MNMTGTKVARETLTVSLIAEMFKTKELREDHPLQRHSDQHSKSYKDGFIATVIKMRTLTLLKSVNKDKAMQP